MGMGGRYFRMKIITEIVEILTSSVIFLSLIAAICIINTIILIRRLKMEKRDNVIQIRVTDEELKNIDRLGNLWNLTRSGLIRRALAEKWRTDQEALKEYEIFIEERDGEK